MILCFPKGRLQVFTRTVLDYILWTSKTFEQVDAQPLYFYYRTLLLRKRTTDGEWLWWAYRRGWRGTLYERLHPVTWFPGRAGITVKVLSSLSFAYVPGEKGHREALCCPRGKISLPLGMDFWGFPFLGYEGVGVYWKQCVSQRKCVSYLHTNQFASGFISLLTLWKNILPVNVAAESLSLWLSTFCTISCRSLSQQVMSIGFAPGIHSS